MNRPDNRLNIVSFSSVGSACIRSLIVVCLICGFVSNALSTWKKVADLYPYSPIPFAVSIFFFDVDHGLVGVDGVSGIWLTNDGGKTWVRAAIPKNYSGAITDIFMTTQLEGWATLEDKPGKSGIWHTLDGGMTWQVVPGMIGNFTSIYQTPTCLMTASRNTLPRLQLSTTNGGSFYPAFFTAVKFNAFNFVDDLHGVLTLGPSASGANNALWTADGGLTWFTNNAVTESWKPYAKKGTSTFVILGERFANDFQTFEDVEVSNDNGRTFNTIATFQGRTTGQIAGVGDVLYIQSDNGSLPPLSQKPGLYRSLDGGRTWKSVGGPSNERDTRFWVGGCLGGTVYAFDGFGGVWKTDDGGDGELNETPHNPNLYPQQSQLLNTSICDRVKTFPRYSNLSCQDLIIDSIYFVDSSDEAISTGALSIATKKLPLTLQTFKSDTIAVTWSPGLLSSTKPKTTFLVRIHSHLTDNSQVFDTIISIDVSSQGNQTPLSLSDTIVRFDSLNICRRAIDTVVTFHNGGCDSLQLLSSILANAADWEVLQVNGQPVKLPIKIAKNGNIQLRIRYTPHSTGKSEDTLKLHFEQKVPLSSKWTGKDTSITLHGLAVRTLNVFGDPPISLTPIPFCEYADTLVTLNNYSCDTLTIDSLITDDLSSTFEILSSLSLPAIIPPGGVLKVRVRFHPKKNLSSVYKLTYTYHIGTDSSTSTIFIQGLGLPGDSYCKSTIAGDTIRFSTTECTNPSIQTCKIFNPGCDSVTIESMTFVTTDGQVLNGSTFQVPKIITPGNDSVGLSILCSTIKQGSFTGQYSIIYRNALGQLDSIHIPVSASIAPAQKTGTLSNQVTNFGALPLCTSRFDTIHIANEGCPILNVSKIDLAGLNYVLVSGPKTPFTLSAGQDTFIVVQFLANASGPYTALLTVRTDDNNLPIKTIAYTATVKPVDLISFRVQQVNKNLVTADTAMIDVIPNRDWKNKGLKKINFSLTYNGDLISYYGKTVAFSPNNQIFVTPVLIGKNEEQLNVSINSPTEIELTQNVPVARFYYTTALTDTIETPVRLSLLELNDDDANYKNCVLLPASTDGDFTIQLICGGRTIRDYMKGELVLTAASPHPNPLDGANDASIQLPFSTTASGEVSLTIYDALGRIRHSITTSVQDGEHSFDVPASVLSAGEYNYILGYKGVSNAFVRGRFVVLH